MRLRRENIRSAFSFLPDKFRKPSMSSSSAPFELVATTSFGLEAVVGRELQALGYADQRVLDGRVFFNGDAEAICRANIWLRSAERVEVVFGKFPAWDFGELFDRTINLPWEQWLPVDAIFPVTGRSVKSQLHSVPDCQRIVKKAIVERLKQVYKIDWLPETGTTYAVEVSLLRDDVTLTIDTSGAGLHKRGYRKLTAKAPLKETLAAALVQLSVWKPERPFADPFCGSGTIPIEAAMIARNIAPGLKRDFASSTWPQIGPELWRRVRDEAQALIKPAPDEVLVGTDIDNEVLEMARYHARQAGVESCVHFQQRSAEVFSSKKQYGCWISNPPYGERLGDEQEIERLYAKMGDVWAPLESWSFFVLTTHTGFERLVGGRATRRRKLYNGKLPCTYYQFLGPRPPASQAEGESVS